MVGAAVARPAVSGAKQKGNTCGKNEKRRCASDATACRTSVLPLCGPPDGDLCAALQSCCSSCSASGFMTCFIAALQP